MILVTDVQGKVVKENHFKNLKYEKVFNYNTPVWLDGGSVGASSNRLQ